MNTPMFFCFYRTHLIDRFTDNIDDTTPGTRDLQEL